MWTWMGVDRKLRAAAVCKEGFHAVVKLYALIEEFLQTLAGLRIRIDKTCDLDARILAGQDVIDVSRAVAADAHEQYADFGMHIRDTVPSFCFMLIHLLYTMRCALQRQNLLLTMRIVACYNALNR